MKRRAFLKSAGIIATGAVIAPNAIAGTTAAMDDFNPETKERGDLNDSYSMKSLRADVNRPITVAVLGAGNRGNVYARYSKQFPSLMQIVAVADIKPERLESFKKLYNLPDSACYNSADEFLAQPKMCDAVIVSTPDDVHYVPTMKALKAGYHVLLEKPMAQTEKEVRDILEMSRKTGGIVGVCHVLRYAPYFVALKAALQTGIIGDVVSVQHMEPIQYAHMAHSYVRGNWRNSDQTTPIILAKSCHDLDILRFLIDKPCESIVADGSLYLFKKENAPEGAPLKCTDGCPHEETCPYSALDIYHRKRRHLGALFNDYTVKHSADDILKALKEGPYGRCVYHCDNNQPDHYVANMVFGGGVTAAFSMEAFTPVGHRRTRIMGTKGFIDGDGRQFTITEFRTMKKHVWNKKISEIPEYNDAGHGGGDHGLLRDFLEAVCWNDASRMSSGVDVSVESHVMGFNAELSRKTGKKVKVKI